MSLNRERDRGLYDVGSADALASIHNAGVSAHP